MAQSRRAFIRKTSVATALTAVGSPLLTYGNKRKHKKKMGIALVGMGYYATKELAPALQETKECYLSGFVTGTPEKEEIYGEKYNIAKENIYNYENYDDIAANPDIDVIYIVLPNSMHKEYTIRAARAGKHVVCEKPMAMNAEECRDMISVCNEEGVGLSIGYRLQYEPYTQKIMQMAENNPYGAITFVNVAAGFRMKRPSTSWKLTAEYGGGALMDMGVYPIQGTRYGTGMEPLTVSAQQFKSDPEVFETVDETTTFQFEFPGGIVANGMTTFAGNVNYLKINALKGQYGLEPFSWYSGLHGFTPDGPFDFPKMNQQAAQMDAQCIAFRENRPSPTPGEEGLRDMIIIDAIRESVRKKGETIPIEGLKKI
jgi:glucose-fructose oxidoreductase